MDKINVLVVDDHPLIREGIVRALEKQDDIRVVAQATDGEEAVTLASILSPDVVIMDVDMPGMDGLEATRQIKANGLKGSVLVMTNYDDKEYMMASLDVGATGYLLKDTYGDELVQAVRAVHLGELVLDLRLAPRGAQALASTFKQISAYLQKKLVSSPKLAHSWI